MIYLFKNCYECTDIFKYLYIEMQSRGYNCVRILDENLNGYDDILKILRKEKVVFICADHLNDGIPNIPWSYSANSVCAYLNPVKKFYAMHDLGVHRIDDNVEGWHILTPHQCWNELFKSFNVKIDTIGHPKFINDAIDIKYDAVFFVSLIYIYAERSPNCFYNDFKTIFDKKIPFKFPKSHKIDKLIELAKSHNIEIIDPNIESFEILMQCNTAISNSASSISVEAAIAGCNSINIGSHYGPDCVYKQFKIDSIPTSVIPNNLLNRSRHNPLLDFKLNIDKAIEIITNDI